MALSMSQLNCGLKERLSQFINVKIHNVNTSRLCVPVIRDAHTVYTLPVLVLRSLTTHSQAMREGT